MSDYDADRSALARCEEESELSAALTAERIEAEDAARA